MTEKEIKAYLGDEKLFYRFKAWMKRNYKLGLTQLDDQKEIDLFLEEYKEKTDGGVPFEAKWGVKYNAFRLWLEDNHGIKIGSLNGSYSPYIEQYKWVSMMNKYTRIEMWNLLYAVVNEAEEFSEKENEVIEYMKSVEVEG